MDRRHVNIVMFCSTLGLSHVLLVVACAFPRLYTATYQLDASTKPEELILTPTRFATHHMWVFVVLLACAGLATVALSRRVRTDTARPLVCGMCVQGLVVWSAAFCLCFDAFAGPMCLHHGPHFEWGVFLTGALGLFPVTLGCLLAPLAKVLFLNPRLAKSLASSDGPNRGSHCPE